MSSLSEGTEWVAISAAIISLGTLALGATNAFSGVRQSTVNQLLKEIEVLQQSVRDARQEAQEARNEARELRIQLNEQANELDKQRKLAVENEQKNITLMARIKTLEGRMDNLDYYSNSG